MLEAEHNADLYKSGLTDETITKCLFESTNPTLLREMGAGFVKAESALEIPYFEISGEKNGFARRKLFPAIKIKDGGTIKYWQPKGSSPHLYLPPLADWHKIISQTASPLLITEGEKKAAAMCQAGLPCIGVGGVWNWREKTEDGGRMVLPAIEQFAWKGRKVEIVPDSDGWRKGKTFDVLAGFYALGMELIQRGAVVTMVVLPESGGVKVGLDDWLVQEKSFWRDAWPKVERLPLDHKKLQALSNWHQKWKAKQTQEVERDEKPRLPRIYLPDELSAVRVQASDALLQANEQQNFFDVVTRYIELRKALKVSSCVSLELTGYAMSCP